MSETKGFMERCYFNDNTIDVSITGEYLAGIYLNFAGEKPKLLKAGEKHKVGSGNTNMLTTQLEAGIRPRRNYHMRGDDEVVMFKKGATLMLTYGFILEGGSKITSQDIIYIGDAEGGESARFVADPVKPDDPQVKGDD